MMTITGECNGVYVHTQNRKPCCIRKPEVDAMLVRVWRADPNVGFSDHEEVYAITEGGTYPVTLITTTDDWKEIPVWVAKIIDPEKYDRVNHEFLKVPEHRLYRPTVN